MDTDTDNRLVVARTGMGKIDKVTQKVQSFDWRINVMNVMYSMVKIANNIVLKVAKRVNLKNSYPFTHPHTNKWLLC